MENFKQLNADELVEIDGGGKTYWKYLSAGVAGGIYTGATAGAATMGVGAIGGIVIGASAGAIWGSAAYVTQSLISGEWY